MAERFLAVASTASDHVPSQLGRSFGELRGRAGEYRGSPRYVARWLCLVAPGAVAIGSAVALFLWSLEHATQLRWQQPWLLWLLPVAALVVGGLYHHLGHDAGHGLHRLPICVELMSAPRRLEEFCRERADLLVGRTVVFRHAEAWKFSLPPALEDEDEASLA